MTFLNLLAVGSLTMPAVASAATPASAEATRPADAAVSAYMHDLAGATGAAVVTPSVPIPSFTRQTGLTCNVCHTAYPQLTLFGRLFKLGGYTMTAQQTVQLQDSAQAPSLRLDLIPPVSAMVIASMTSVSRDVPDEQNRSMAFPQELGLFFGEAISPKLGAFLQLTYDPAEGGISIDNADIRFANNGKIAGQNVLYGVTINNSPTVQDVWNSTPVWGFPWSSSDVAPAPMAATLVDGTLGQQVMGMGAYALWNNRLYTEASFYRSAFQGGPVPVDGSAENAIHGMSPYWRVALLHMVENGQLMVGSYGMVSRLTPSGFRGPRDHYTDVAFDAQWDREWQNGSTFVAHGTWIHESRDLAGTAGIGGAIHTTGNLSTARLDATYYWPSRVGVSAGLFSTTGSSDSLLYPDDPVTGSATGNPNSQGFVVQLSFMPWLNTRLGAQYVGYSKFNGASQNYDGHGRDAADNNALYLMTWLVF